MELNQTRGVRVMSKKEFNLSVVKDIVLPLRQAGESNKQIADTLNKNGLLTTSGKKWTGGNVSILCLNHLGQPRRKNTSKGAAGSTGGYSRLNGLAVRRSKSAPRSSVIYRDMEDVMTSNLNPKLKIRLIAKLSREI